MMRKRMTVACGALAMTMLAPGAARSQDAPPPPPVTPGAPGAPAGQTDAAKTYTLASHYRVGDIERYRMQMTGHMEMTAAKGQSPAPGGEFTASMNMRIKTVGMKPDGTAVVAVHTEGGEVSAMGHPQPMPSVPDYLMEIDARGHAKMRAPQTLPGADVLSKIFDMNQMPAFGSILPDHPVKIGDTWESRVPMASGQTMKLESTLLGLERIAGRDTYRIGQKVTMPIVMSIGQDGKPTTETAGAAMAMRGSAVVNSIMNIATDNGHLVRSAGDVKGAVEMKLQGPAAQQSPFGDSLTMKMDEHMAMTLLGTGTVPPAPAAKK